MTEQVPLENPRAVIGANNPPPYDAAKLAELDAKAREVADAAGAWQDLGQIDTEEQAQMLGDFVSGATKVEKAIEAARSDAKKPHMEAGKAVDEAFKIPGLIVTRAKDKAKALLTGYLQRKAEEQRREQARQTEIARMAQENAAKDAALAVANNDVVGQIEAEEAAAAAKKALKQAEKGPETKVQSYTGAGRTIALRTTRHAVIHNQNAVYMRFREHPDVADVLQRLATQAIRSGEVFPETVITVKEVETAA